jgi:hypothetical protein
MDAPDHLIPLHLSEVFWSDRSGSNGRIRRGRGAHHGPRVPTRIPASAHWNRTPASFDDRRRQWRCRRDAGDNGELGGLTSVDFRFLGRRRTATGGAPRIGKMQMRAGSTVCCRFRQNKGMRRCAGSWYEAWGWRGNAGTHHCADINRKYLQVCGAPARNFASLAAIWAREMRGKGRGGRGLFIGTGYRRNGRGLKGNLRGSNGGRGLGLWRDWWPEVDDDLVLTRGSHQSAGERGGEVPVQEEALLGHGLAS